MFAKAVRNMLSRANARSSLKSVKSVISNVRLAFPRAGSERRACFRHHHFLPFSRSFRVSALMLFLFRFHSRRLPSHRVAALKIMYFRDGVGRIFFLRESLVSLSAVSPPVLFPLALLSLIPFFSFHSRASV